MAFLAVNPSLKFIKKNNFSIFLDEMLFIEIFEKNMVKFVQKKST